MPLIPLPLIPPRQLHLEPLQAPDLPQRSEHLGLRHRAHLGTVPDPYVQLAETGHGLERPPDLEPGVSVIGRWWLQARVEEAYTVPFDVEAADGGQAVREDGGCEPENGVVVAEEEEGVVAVEEVDCFGVSGCFC